MRERVARLSAPGEGLPARLATAFLCALLLAACGGREAARERATALTGGGDPVRGARLIRHYGCDACHTIPGIEGADREVGPPLAGVANRMFIGGVLANTPSNMMRWIENPQAVDPLTAMPALGVGAAEARDIAAYLYTLR
jgi:cytochrome c2